MKKILNIISSILLMTSNSAFANPQTIVNQPQGVSKGLIVIAPAKKYLMQERLFEGIAQNLAKQGFVVVRFNWDNQTLTDPALEFKRASNDFYTVVSEAQKYFKAGRQNTVIISKSFSTKALGLVENLAKAQVLLTPNCSPEVPFLGTYGSILQRKDIKTSIFISSEDPYCDVKQIHQSLIQVQNSPTLYLSHGDHNFVIPNPPTNLSIHDSGNFIYQDTVIQMVTIQVLSDFFKGK